VNVVDSSGWLEYFADGPNADFFAPAVEDLENLLVPSISLLEVFKRILQQRGENAALKAVAQMRGGQVIDLDGTLALNAARISLALKLPLADSVILATARAYGATAWTQDSDFKGIEGVKYIPRK
jgi:predicted nucleic acid-binding protein